MLTIQNRVNIYKSKKPDEVINMPQIILNLTNY